MNRKRQAIGLAVGTDLETGFVGQGIGPARKNLKRTEIPRVIHQSKFHTPDLPPVAGIVTSLSNNYGNNSASGTFCTESQSNFGTHDRISSEDEKKPNDSTFSRLEVIHGLRALEQPITLFGEEDDDRLKRFKILNNLLTSQYRLSPRVDGKCNDLTLGLVDMKKYDRHVLLRRDNKIKMKSKDSLEDGNLDSYPGVESSSILASIDNMIPYDAKFDFDKGCTEDKILFFFKQLLKEWDGELQKRPESEKRTEKGRSYVTVLEESVAYLDPIVSICSNPMGLPVDLRQDILQIVIHCLQRDYLAAMFRYIRLAFREAPCLIGLNLLDIQERGREKVSTNDPTRNCLLSVKRLISLCQRRYPGMASKSVKHIVLSSENGNDFVTSFT